MMAERTGKQATKQAGRRCSRLEPKQTMAAKPSQEDKGIVAYLFRSMLPWLGFVMAVYAAHGLEDALASSSPTLWTRTSGVGESRSSPMIAQSASPRRIPLTIVLHDSSTGREWEWQCMSMPGSAPGEDLILDANALADVAVSMCS